MIVTFPYYYLQGQNTEIILSLLGNMTGILPDMTMSHFFRRWDSKSRLP